MARRHHRILDQRRLWKLALFLLSFGFFVGDAVADPNLPASKFPPLKPPATAPTVAPASTVATVTANLNSKGATIPSDFVSFSTETQDVIADTIFTSANTS